jgi:hypothetical protein
MTWSTKVVRVALAIGVAGAVALASGANYVDQWLWWLWW